MSSENRRKFLRAAGGATVALAAGAKCADHHIVVNNCCDSHDELETENVLSLSLGEVSGIKCVNRYPEHGLKLVKGKQRAFIVRLGSPADTPVTCTVAGGVDLGDLFEIYPTNPFTLNEGEHELFLFKVDLGGLVPRDDKFKDALPPWAKTFSFTFEPVACAGINTDHNDIHVEC